eukprot:PhF_6_TR7067/c0_g1_i1/m.10687
MENEKISESARNQLLLHQDVLKQLLKDRERDTATISNLQKTISSMQSHLQKMTAERDGLLEAIQLEQITKTKLQKAADGFRTVTDKEKVLSPLKLNTYVTRNTKRQAMESDL